MKLMAVEEVPVSCASAPEGFCEINFLSTEKSLAIPIYKTDLSISFQNATAVPLINGQEQWSFIYQVQNNSILESHGEANVNFYLDLNDNESLDVEVDSLLTSISIPMGRF